MATPIEHADHDDTTPFSRPGPTPTPLVVALLVILSALPPRLALAAAPPRFGGEVIGADSYGHLTANGARVYEVVGPGISWSGLQPDSQTFDPVRIQALDNDVRSAFASGIQQMILRVTPGGSQLDPFSGPTSSWPVDTASYEYKDGEYLGSQNGPLTVTFPPKLLTDDTAGNTSPWYEFVKELVSRYDGTTTDPQNPAKKLPRIDYWSCVEEPDQTGFWYGTSKEYFGGLGGDPAVGTLPSFYRAVKAANPGATVIGGGLASHEVGLYMVHLMAQAHGDLYDPAVRAYGTGYFNTNYPLQQVIGLQIPDDSLYQSMETDPARRHARTMIDALFGTDAGDYYDVLAIHSYDNWEMLSDLIDFHRQRMAAPKPVWITELGFGDTPPKDRATLVTEEDQAVWLVKKLVIGLADGVQQMTYAPTFAFRGFAEIYPSKTSERLARRSMHLIGRALDETSGYHYASSFTSAGSEFHLFARTDGVSHLAIAWRGAGSAVQDAGAILGIPGNASVRVLDHLERVVSTGDTTLTVSPTPLAIFWSTAVLDADGDGVPGPVDCADDDAAVSPNLTENANDAKDNDCNPVTPSGTGPSCASVSLSGAGRGVALDTLLPFLATAAVASWRRARSGR